MKIYSWNMLFRNKEQERAFGWIKSLDFDIFCLQEVPGAFLERLKTLPYNLSHRIDCHRSDIDKDIYVVILTKYPIVRDGDIPFETLVKPAHTHAFIKLMKPFHFTHVSGRHGAYADVDIPGMDTALRVFSVHLSLTTPEARMNEFACVMTERMPGYDTIVCGDFNILESPKVTLLNWFMGGTFHDVFTWHKERANLEQRFKEAGLANPLRGMRTHPFSRSQLDHILIPSGTVVLGSKVLNDSYGSDHRPVLVAAKVMASKRAPGA